MPKFHHRRLAFRAPAEPIAAPTGVAGIGGDKVSVVDSGGATKSDFQFDTAATAAPTDSPNVIPIVQSFTPTITTGKAAIATAVVTSEGSEPSTSVVAASNASKPIPISTVVGACAGAFIACILLIYAGVAVYRRGNNRMRERSRMQGGQRGMASRPQRSDWGKLGDEDTWEGKYPETKEANTVTVGPMENLTMFKKSPSIRSNSEKEGFATNFDVTKYTPKLAEELSVAEVTSVPRPFLGRLDTGPAISWDGETITSDRSFLSLHPNTLSTVSVNEREKGSMSPTPRAIPTPPAIKSAIHRWESVEVEHFSDNDTVNPFADTPGNTNSLTGGTRRSEVETTPSKSRPRSTSNPFFGAQEDISHRRSRSSVSLTRSRSNSTRSRSSIVRGKQRAIDPFNDDDDIPDMPPTPSQTGFTTHSSSAGLYAQSQVGSERALVSLIAALDFVPVGPDDPTVAGQLGDAPPMPSLRDSGLEGVLGVSGGIPRLGQVECDEDDGGQEARLRIQSVRSSMVLNSPSPRTPKGFDVGSRSDKGGMRGVEEGDDDEMVEFPPPSRLDKGKGVDRG